MNPIQVTELSKNAACQGVMYDWFWLFTDPIKLINPGVLTGSGLYKALKVNHLGTRQTEIITPTGTLRKMTPRPNHETPKGNFTRWVEFIPTGLIYIHVMCWREAKPLQWVGGLCFLFPQLDDFFLTHHMCCMTDLYWICSKL